ncbi:MAG: recombinase family protein, partial [Pseudomonadota bacterium]
LDAQREACEAYIASQKHEGWVALPDHFDDGGVSGGTLERASLQKLLQAVDEGRVDQIVVYKIDRLTRSLMDFSRLIERLDAARASFVSVTQSFNTATSMGRLTLNVLLSFAQFEREVTAERIRDKIAASKRKGMWMGGPLPLGYRSEDRHLIVHSEEAKTVRLIYDLYLRLGTVRALQMELEKMGIVSPISVTKAEKPRGGKPYPRGHLHRILANPIYVGRVGHKGKVYEGQHTGIIGQEQWDSVQAKLQQTSSTARARKRFTEQDDPSTNGQPNGSRHPVNGPYRALKTPSLVGKLFDEAGDRLTPSHANKKGRRYRYYVSNRLIKRSGETQPQGGWRLPARVLEQAVVSIVCGWLSDHRQVQALLPPGHRDAYTIAALINAAERLRDRLALGNSSQADPLDVVASLISKATIGNAQIEIELDRSRLFETLAMQDLAIPALKPPQPSKLNPATTEMVLFEPKHDQTHCDPILIRGSFEHRKRGNESKLVLGMNPNTKPDPVLIANIARARDWLSDIHQGRSIADIAQAENRSIRQVQRHLEFAFLSPKIIQSITEGTQPPEITSRQLLSTALPMDWDEQHRLFGMG